MKCDVAAGFACLPNAALVCLLYSHSHSHPPPPPRSVFGYEKPDSRQKRAVIRDLKSDLSFQRLTLNAPRAAPLISGALLYLFPLGLLDRVINPSIHPSIHQHLLGVGQLAHERNARHEVGGGGGVQHSVAVVAEHRDGAPAVLHEVGATEGEGRVAHSELVAHAQHSGRALPATART